MCSLLSETSHQQQANPIKLQGQAPHSPALRSESSNVGPCGTQHKGNCDPSYDQQLFSTPAVPIILQKASSQLTSTGNHPCAVLTPFDAYPQEISPCGRESSISLSDVHLMTDLFTETAKRKV